MTIRLNPRWLLISALLFSLQVCHAQIVVPPSLSFDLGGTDATNSRLWDIGGSYTLNLNVQEKRGSIVVPVQLSFNLIQGANGQLTTSSNDFGEGLVLNNDDNSLFAVTPQLSGKVTGSGGTARVHFTVRFSGSGKLAGQPNVNVNGSLTVDAETDPSTGQLVGTKDGKFSASFSGASTLQGVVTDFANPLPPGVDGTWNLTLHIAALSKISGTGVITTPSRALGLDLSGGFKNGLFKINANGAGNVQDTQSGAGSSATMQLTTSFDTLLFKGKFLGQKLLFGASPSAQ